MSEPQNTSTTMLAERVRRGQSSTAAREKTRLIMEAVKPTHAMLITTNSGPDTDVCVSSSWESPCAAGEKGCGDLEANMGDWAPWLGTLRDRDKRGLWEPRAEPGGAEVARLNASVLRLGDLGAGTVGTVGLWGQAWGQAW